MLRNALPPPSPATSDSALQASFLMHRHILDSTSCSYRHSLLLYGWMSHLDLITT
ncbi:unnamed protein product, partial [Staurois parvus]